MREDDGIIKEGLSKLYILQNLMYQPLECADCIHDPKGHPKCPMPGIANAVLKMSNKPLPACMPW